MSIVNVKAANDLLDLNDGTVSVPKGTAGIVEGPLGTMAAPVYEVTFTTSGGPVTRKVAPAEVVFEDGAIGPARAWLEDSMNVLTAIRYQGVAADYEQQLGGFPSSVDGSIELVFDGVGTLRISANRNSGALDVALL